MYMQKSFVCTRHLRFRLATFTTNPLSCTPLTTCADSSTLSELSRAILLNSPHHDEPTEEKALSKMAARPPPPGQKPPATGQTPNTGTPNQTLYVKNLNDKINRDDLKRSLYMLFSTYGTVLDVVTVRVGSKSQSMRGQAHVVFRDVQTSTQAMRALQGFEMFDKEMVVAYAKGTSGIIPKLRGTFEPSAVQAPTTESTELQKSIFNAPPSSIPAKPAQNRTTTAQDSGPHGTKRPREEVEEEDDDDVEMEEDDDAPMDEDDDD